LQSEIINMISLFSDGIENNACILCKSHQYNSQSVLFFKQFFSQTLHLTLDT
jgi:hypothetical protein